MSSSDAPADRLKAAIPRLPDICAAIEAAVVADTVDDVPDETVTALLSAASALFAKRTLDHKRSIPALAPSAAVTPTAVVVTVSAMLRAADLNSFDLAMWFNRPTDFPT